MKEKFAKVFREHLFAFVGCGAGLLAAVLMLTVGFWGTLLLAILGGLGLWLGACADKGKSISQVLFNAFLKAKKLFAALFGGR